MDFIIGLCLSILKKSAFWVIVDVLIKSAHLLPIHDTWSIERFAQLYVKKTVRLHKIPKDIVFDRGQRFQVRFWQALQKAFGTKLNFSSSFHPEIDGHTKWVNQVLEDMLRAFVLVFQEKWEKYLPLLEFSYNNSYQSTIQMAPFKAVYGLKCRIPLCWKDPDEALIIGPELSQKNHQVG